MVRRSARLVRSAAGATTILAAMIAGAAVIVSARSGRSPSVFTSSQVERGAGLYAHACVGCHGPDLSGGKVVPGLVGVAFGSRWSGRAVSELLDLMVRSMPVEDPSSLSPADKTDVLAYILSANGWRPGSKPLSHEAEELSEIVFEVVSWPEP